MAPAVECDRGGDAHSGWPPPAAVVWGHRPDACASAQCCSGEPLRATAPPTRTGLVWGDERPPRRRRGGPLHTTARGVCHPTCGNAARGWLGRPPEARVGEDARPPGATSHLRQKPDAAGGGRVGHPPPAVMAAARARGGRHWHRRRRARARRVHPQGPSGWSGAGRGGVIPFVAAVAVTAPPLVGPLPVPQCGYKAGEYMSTIPCVAAVAVAAPPRVGPLPVPQCGY